MPAADAAGMSMFRTSIAARTSALQSPSRAIVPASKGVLRSATIATQPLADATISSGVIVRACGLTTTSPRPRSASSAAP